MNLFVFERFESLDSDHTVRLDHSYNLASRRQIPTVTTPYLFLRRPGTAVGSISPCRVQAREIGE